jgi:hypothetical protein
MARNLNFYISVIDHNMRIEGFIERFKFFSDDSKEN